MNSQGIKTTNRRQGEHAVIIGGSMSGMLVARVLSEHFDRVTILERDQVHDRAEVRKGQAHGRQLHALLASGFHVMCRYFPDLRQALVDGGAVVGDLTERLRWYANGGYRIQHACGMEGVMVSRPYLEWLIRRRVLALPNVTLIDECAVEGLEIDDSTGRVTGVRMHERVADQSKVIRADLTIDVSGRGSPSPKWLAAMGYGQPEESVIKVNIGYSTRLYRRKPGDLEGADAIMIPPDAPTGKRTGYAFPAEDNIWVVALGGRLGEYPPTDEAGFVAYARTLPAPDIANLLAHLEPVSEITPYRYPTSTRRHYEKMARFPEGYLVMGDAVCSFNPVYGQGMSSAALQVETLDRLLTEHESLAGLARQFFPRAAKIVDIPWQVAAGEDFRYPETEGKKAPGTDLINRYMDRLNRATHGDPVVYDAFVQVVNLLAPPTSLMKPAIFWRVMRAKSSKAAAAPSLVAQPAEVQAIG